MIMKFAIPMALMATALLVGCASAPKTELVAACVFADGSNQPAPEWVCGAPVEGVELAQSYRVEVQNMIKQFAETTGVADSETVDMVNTSVTKQITKETLAGSKIFRQMATPSGGIVVVVGLDAASFEKLQKHAIQTYMNNEKALWQKFSAGKAFDELADEMTKMQ